MDVTSNNTKKTVRKSSEKSAQVEQTKGCIRDFHDYFLDNYKYFQRMRRFIFVSSLAEKDKTIYQDLGWPVLEFPILEAFISRLLGEFAASEPFVTVRKKSNTNVSPELLTLIEGFFRNIFTESNRDNMEYETYRDCLGGGFSAIKVYTDYSNHLSHHQDVMMRRAFNPCLVGFDKKATMSHKGDGEYCYEIFPKSKEDFIKEYGSKPAEKMKFRKGAGDLYGYNWSYAGSKDGEEIVLVADFYKKKYTPIKTVLLSDGQTMTEEKYEKFARDFFKNTMMQAPKIVGKPRETEIIQIQRQVVCENDVLSEEMTDYEDLPFIFVDGNSILNQSEDGCVKQVVRSYVHHLVSTQKLKNLAGIMTGNELENTMQHKLMISEQALPADDAQREALTNYQKSKLVVYNGRNEDNPMIPLQPPMPIPRVPAPPEMLATFQMTDSSAQAILGTRDAEIGQNQRFVSGDAIEQAATQSNMAARCYRVNYLKAWNQVAKVMFNLMPKVMTLPRTIPVKDISGNFDQAEINTDQSPQIKDMDTQLMEIVVQAGVDFENQRGRAAMMLEKLAAQIPMIGEILGTTPQGLSMVLDNIDMRGIDSLKAIVPQFAAQMQQQKQQMMQAQQQQMQMQQQQAMVPVMLKQEELKLAQMKTQSDIHLAQMKLQAESQIAQTKLQVEYQLELAKLGIEQQNADTKQYEAISKSSDNTDKIMLDMQKVDAQNARTAADVMQIDGSSKHTKAMDLLNLDHAKNMDTMKHDLERIKVDLNDKRENQKINISVNNNKKSQKDKKSS